MLLTMITLLAKVMNAIDRVVFVELQPQLEPSIKNVETTNVG